MNGQPNQQSQNAVTEEEKRVCKKCEKRLPNKSYFCMYCGTDNAPTSVQVEYEKANNESLKKYTVIEGKKQSPLWYIIFMLLVIDVIAVNFTLIKHHNDIYKKVNSAKFQYYEKSYYLGEDAYLAVKDNKVRIIGSNRMKYSNITNELRKHEITDVQQVNDFYHEEIYARTSKGKIYIIDDTEITEVESDTEYMDVYHYINSKTNNCYNDTEYIELDDEAYYFDPTVNEIKYIEDSKYVLNNERYCMSFIKTTAITSDELNLENPELVYQSYDGRKIILKDDKELVTIRSGTIEERLKEIKIKESTVKVEDIKAIFYINNKYLIIDKKDNIYNEKYSIEEELSSIGISGSIPVPDLEYMIKYQKEELFELIAILVVLIVDVIFLYRMSDNHTFSKIMSLSGMLMIEFVIYMLIKAQGIDFISSGKVFMLLLEALFQLYLVLIIASTAIVQMSELTIKLLDFIKFRNIFSYFPTFLAIISVFLSVLISDANGAFFAVFLLGTYWSYLTETEELDIDLFITPSSYVPIAVLTGANIILFFVLLDIFKISNYFVMLFFLAILFAIYLASRPNLAKKELTGKSIKSLLVIIMTLVVNFISTLFTMNLFTVLQKDDGTIMKAVLALGFKDVLYLVVTFAVLVLISSVLRIIHKVIKKVCKNTNSVVQGLIFSMIALVLFAIITYFYPEIVNIIDVGVNNIFTAIVK